jgi:hypothetical protein
LESAQVISLCQENAIVKKLSRPDTPPIASRRKGDECELFDLSNPISTGSFVLQYNGTRRGELIFAQQPNTTKSNSAQQPNTTESNSAQQPTTTESNSAQELVMLDITGKVVFKTNVVVNGNPIEIKFSDLASGVYVVLVGEERMRLIVE